MKKKQKGGQLKDMKITEVSIVDAPANRREFLFIKSDLEKAEADIQIKSDGSLQGTEITVNGKKIEDLKSFYFSFYKPADDEEVYIDPVSCSYTVTSDAEDGFVTSETYNLSKAKGKTMDFQRVIDFVKELTGETLTKAQIEKWDADKQRAWSIMSLYETQFTPELHESLGKLMKPEAAPDTSDAPSEEPPAEGSEETPGKKKMAEIVAGLDAIKAIIDGSGAEEPTDATEALEEVKKLKARLAKIEVGEPPEQKPGDSPADESGMAQVLAALEDIKSRLEVVEKSAGVKKDLGSDPGESDAGKKWPSFTS